MIGQSPSIEGRVGIRPSGTTTSITKVGLWFLLLGMIVGIAATNTGNNALYMVLASMISMLVLVWAAARLNLSRLRLAVELPDEAFANRPFEVGIELFGPRYRPQRGVVFQMNGVAPMLVENVSSGDREGALLKASQEILLTRRGLHRLSDSRALSLYPLGFFRKCLDFDVPEALLVFPELYPAAPIERRSTMNRSNESSRRRGRSQDVHSLRPFRDGDDLRSIHWKQSARQDDLVYLLRAAEESRRLLVVLDNAVGTDLDEAEANRFERLVSEAATVCVDSLEQGFEVELVTRDSRIPFSAGRAQRRAILEHLALLEHRERSDRPLEAGAGDTVSRHFSLGRQDERVGHPTPGGAPRYRREATA